MLFSACIFKSWFSLSSFLRRSDSKSISFILLSMSESLTCTLNRCVMAVIMMTIMHTMITMMASRCMRSLAVPSFCACLS